MGELTDAAVGFPGVAFSSALAVVVCFWLLVALGVGRADSFDEDADLDAVGLGGVPVAVAVSLLTCTGWAVSLAGTVAVARTHWAGLAHAAGDVGVLAASVLLGWALTYALVRPAARVRAVRAVRDGPLPRDLAGSVRAARTGRVVTGTDTVVDTGAGRARAVPPSGTVVAPESRRGPAVAATSAVPVTSVTSPASVTTAASATPVAATRAVTSASSVTSARPAPGDPLTADGTWPHADCA